MRAGNSRVKWAKITDRWRLGWNCIKGHEKTNLPFVKRKTTNSKIVDDNVNVYQINSFLQTCQSKFTNKFKWPLQLYIICSIFMIVENFSAIHLWTCKFVIWSLFTLEILLIQQKFNEASFCVIRSQDCKCLVKQNKYFRWWRL